MARKLVHERLGARASSATGPEGRVADGSGRGRKSSEEQLADEARVSPLGLARRLGYVGALLFSACLLQPLLFRSCAFEEEYPNPIIEMAAKRKTTVIA